MTDILQRLRRSRIVPVVTLASEEDAVPVARALLKGGINAMEIVLRTDAAYEAARRVKAEVPEIALGIGSVFHSNQIAFCEEVVPDFVVTPGTTAQLYDAMAETELALVPGVGTMSEAVRALERGFEMVKFFPAEASGGVAALKAMGAPVPDLSFMPTGGVSTANMRTYLALENVPCVGGSWITTDPDPAKVEATARAALDALDS